MQPLVTISCKNSLIIHLLIKWSVCNRLEDTNITKFNFFSNLPLCVTQKTSFLTSKFMFFPNYCIYFDISPFDLLGNVLTWFLWVVRLYDSWFNTKIISFPSKMSDISQKNSNFASNFEKKSNKFPVFLNVHAVFHGFDWFLDIISPKEYFKIPPEALNWILEVFLGHLYTNQLLTK